MRDRMVNGLNLNDFCGSCPERRGGAGRRQKGSGDRRVRCDRRRRHEKAGSKRRSGRFCAWKQPLEYAKIELLSWTGSPQGGWKRGFGGAESIFSPSTMDSETLARE